MKLFSLRNVSLVYRKELLDIIRDRRTLISMILVPLLMIPLVTIGFGSLMEKQQKSLENQVYRVFVIHTVQWMDLYTKLLATENLIIEDYGDNLGAARTMLKDGKIQVVLLLPPERPDRNLGIASFTILVDQSNERSSIAAKKLKERLEEIRRQETAARLKEMNVPETVLTPFAWEEENVASDEEMIGMILGLLLPYMMIILTMSGGTYPAIDLTAGEKERSTLETLLVSPVGRVEVVLGKFFTVMTTALVTAAISLISLAVMMGYGFTTFMTNQVEGISFSINLGYLLLALGMMIPLTALLASLLLTVAIFAKSTREAQSYIVPLYILLIFPAMMSMMPGTTLTKEQVWIPIINIALAMKSILMGSPDVGNILLVLLAMTIYAAVGIFITIRVFQREQVLFRV